MSTSNAVRFLEKGGVDDELALEMYWGKVYESFYSATLLWNAADGAAGVNANDTSALPSELVSSKTITSGKSWQFIMVGDDGDPETHTPGTELLGQNYTFDEGNVTIDGILVKHFDMPLDQMQTAHWDVTSKLAVKTGRSLATNFDRRLFSIAAQSALAPSATKDGISLHNGGNVVERIGASKEAAYPVSSTGAKQFRDDVEHLAQLMDEDNVPDGGRHLIVNSYIQRVLLQDTAIFDVRINSDANPNSLNTRNIGMIGGFMIHKSNHIPDSNLTGSSLGGNLPAKYQHDFTVDGSDDGQPVAIALCGADEGDGAIGYVAASNSELGPIFAHMEADHRRNTLFLKGQMMVGAGQLDVKCAGCILVDSA